ncbi:SPFH domain-containing protein [Chloroflexus islandicus]|nr:SPFH domain-containing protein [Chloroflexus islandicus]
MNSRLSFVGGFIVLLIIAGIGLSTMKYVQVDEGQAAIELVQGRIVAVHGPGPIFRPFAPFTEIELVNVRRQARQISQNVASSDKQLYDIDIQVDFRRLPTEQALRAAYAEIGVSDTLLGDFLDGFINDALKSASTQFTLDEALSDRGSFAERIRRFLTTPPGDGQRAPVDQLYITIEAVKVLDIKVGDTYAQLLAEKANLEVQIETEQKRRQQIEAQQANNLFQAEQEALVALTREKGITAAALEAANREAQVRAIEGRYWRENPELFELRKRELLVQMMSKGNVWFVDPNTNLTLLLNNQAGDGQALVIPQPAPSNP